MTPYRIAILLLVFLLNVSSQGSAEDQKTDLKSPIPQAQAVRCILGEARGEYAKQGERAFVAIAEVLRRRGSTQGVYGCTDTIPAKDMVYMKAKGYFRIAEQAWKKSATTNITNRATHWESTDFPVPYWAEKMKVVAIIGKHKFYKEN